ncbi:hypothetical protein KM043_012352 [Ampulex compressa]|nr:hypothetical protein KM043_012352 [Ampulex compressa]
MGHRGVAREASERRARGEREASERTEREGREGRKGPRRERELRARFAGGVRREDGNTSGRISGTKRIASRVLAKYEGGHGEAGRRSGEEYRAEEESERLEDGPSLCRL